MSTTGSTAASTAADLAAAVREAGFVRLLPTAGGDALAATGLLARGCEAAGVPFQASVARTDAARQRRLADADGDLAVVVGADAGATGSESGRDGPTPQQAGRGEPATHSLPARAGPASTTAHAAATDLGADPDPVLALAGAFAGGVTPGAGGTADLLETAEAAGAVVRRPGVALPVADAGDGLAHQSLVHAEFADDESAAADLAADAGPVGDAGRSDVADTADAAGGADDEARRELASLVALTAAGDERATARSADALERALRPYATPEGPFETVGGYADVLTSVARTAPGTGVALALSGTAREPALSAWREHGAAAHAALRSATTGRYDGLLVARLDSAAPVETVAELLLAWRSPEPAVLVVGDEEAAAVAAAESDRDVAAAMRAAVDEVGGEAGGGAGRAYARHDAETRALVGAFREGDA